MWFNNFSSPTDEYKGHCLLDAARLADPARVKKYLTLDVINFKHPFTGDTPLVSVYFSNMIYFLYLSFVLYTFKIRAFKFCLYLF